jgi:hypothetical protein
MNVLHWNISKPGAISGIGEGSTKMNFIKSGKDCEK